MIKKPAKSPKSSKAARTAKSAQPPSPAILQTAGEQALREVQRALAQQNFANIDEVNSFLAGLMGPGGHDFGAPRGRRSQKDEAQELAFAAMEAKTEARMRKLATQAVAKDPDCVDALLILAGFEAETPEQAIEALQKAVAAGERSLGAKFIAKNKGHFWLILETRPYMRALEQLASAYRAADLNREAIGIYEKMLALNPNDNQGVRDPLLGLYLATGKLEGAAKLLKDYEDDSMANFAWGRALERFLSHDLAGAAAALKKARKANGFVELYLGGEKEIPKFLPDMYSPGSDEEAILCIDNMAVAWAEHQDAVFWLLTQLAEVPASQAAASKLKLVPAKKGKA